MPPLAPRAAPTPPESRASALEGGERADRSGVDFAGDAAAAQAQAEAFASSIVVTVPQPVVLPNVPETYGFAEGDPNSPDG